MSQNIVINNDNLVEGDEVFSVAGSSNDPRAVIMGSPDSITIIDDDGELTCNLTVTVADQIWRCYINIRT